MVIASPAVLNMWPLHSKLDDEKWKHAPVWLRKIVWALHCYTVRGGCELAHQRFAPATEKTVIKWCDWLLLSVSDWSKWFAITSLSPICSPSCGSFMGRVAQKWISTLGCEKYLCRVTYWAPLEMLLDSICSCTCTPNWGFY
jgi:hypothetical protein